MNQLTKKFQKNGVVKLENFFSDEEVMQINDRATNLIQNEYDFLYTINKTKLDCLYLSKKKFTGLKEVLKNECTNDDFKIKSLENFDLLEDEVFSQIFLSDKVLNIYRELLDNNNLIYHGESSLSFNKPPVTGWHSDDQINYSLNSSKKTFQIRGGFFYQSQEGLSGGTKFLLGSHYYVSPSKFIKKIIKKIIRNKSFDNSIFNTRLLFAKNYFPGKKDFCLWDKRIMHSPWSIRLKVLSGLSLSPTIERYFLKSDYLKIFYKEKSFPRSLGSLDFGVESSEYDMYLENLSNRQSYKKYWEKKKFILNENFLSLLSKKNIKFNDLCFKK